MSFTAQHFNRLHSDQQDPWSFRTRWYEQRKRALTLAILPQRRYRIGFELGCSIGELTADLASRCDKILAWDVSAVALETAAQRLVAFANVHLECRRVPEDWPSTVADLIVVSEIGYFLAAHEIESLRQRIEETLTPDGALLLCHWRHPVAGSDLDGDRVHQLFKQSQILRSISILEERDFCLTVMTREGRSVADMEGLLQ